MLPITLPPFLYDQKIIAWANSFHNQFLDKVMVLIANASEYAIIWIVIAILIWLFDRKNGRKVFFTVAIALLIEVILNDLLAKHLIYRERPYLALASVHHMGPNWANSSFFSGHTASTIAVIIVLINYYKKALIPLLMTGALIIWTRLYLGMHYPSDIIAGIIAGAIAARLAFKVISKGLKYNKIRNFFK